VSIIGANGAGKTSLMKCLSGIHPVWEGEIRFQGENITPVAAPQRVARGMALVPEGRRIFPRLTVMENLDLGAYLRKDRAEIAADLEKVFELFPVLAERRTQAGGTLSGGEQQMLAIGRALMSRPSLLLMDEPSMGVAPLLVAKIFETVKSLNQAGLTILLVEQNARLALKVAHRAYVLEIGTITLEGSGAGLLEDERVQRAYLGAV
jgi:branched-chain amino acid transport system ATP-binding protein